MSVIRFVRSIRRVVIWNDIDSDELHFILVLFTIGLNKCPIDEVIASYIFDVGASVQTCQFKMMMTNANY